MDKKILVLGDIHFPYHNRRALEKVYLAIKKEKPIYIIQIGDLYDQYFASRFSKDVNFNTPQKELAAGFKAASEMWKKIKELAPQAKCLQILGNHDVRVIKRVQEKLPEIQSLVEKPIRDLYTFDGVKTVYDYRQETQLEDLLIHHGYLSQLGAHTRKYNKSIIVGHSHVGGVYYHNFNNKNLFELNAGYLADKTAVPLQYNESKIKAWTLGYGLITKPEGSKIWQPQFISFE